MNNFIEKIILCKNYHLKIDLFFIKYFILLILLPFSKKMRNCFYLLIISSLLAFCQASQENDLCISQELCEERNAILWLGLPIQVTEYTPVRLPDFLKPGKEELVGLGVDIRYHVPLHTLSAANVTKAFNLIRKDKHTWYTIMEKKLGGYTSVVFNHNSPVHFQHEDGKMALVDFEFTTSLSLKSLEDRFRRIIKSSEFQLPELTIYSQDEVISNLDVKPVFPSIHERIALEKAAKEKSGILYPSLKLSKNSKWMLEMFVATMSL